MKFRKYFLISMLAALSIKATESKLMDGFAVSVENDILLISDAHLHAGINRWLNRTALSIDDTQQNFNLYARRAVFESLVMQEVKSLGVFDRFRSEIGERLASSLRRSDWSDLVAFARKYGFTDSELRLKVIDKFVVDRFLDTKMQVLSPLITDSECDEYFEEHKAEFQGVIAASVREMIRKKIERQQFEKYSNDWAKFLKQKYKTVYHLPELRDSVR